MSSTSNAQPPQLWNTPSTQPADDTTLEQYKLYVETTDRLASRRDAANAFFVTVHTGLMAGAGFIFEKLN